ncbi:hypothetical protein [Paenibacillus protaetiae]|uniref:Tat pathway signal sequence domain protein n=1 Tax=Paenibacillus protaetiae TaxID=2509456 RepID=A0A4P6EST4_9BACL|nr:hypothetical protein [Paenibacillus protaetiae]QAY65053.1 hypothetical protein ET464_00280 [Paenibacillus protaetiae]
MSGTAVKVGWLKEAPSVPAGVTWGIPWGEGELNRNEELALAVPDGGTAPALQSWPTAFWPDGSVKWTAHAASFPAAEAGGYDVVKGKQAPGGGKLLVQETEEEITVDTGMIAFIVPKYGDRIISSILRGGKEICGGGRLIAMKETSFAASGFRTIKEENFHSRLQEVKLEQAGPVRAVIKLSGKHRSAAGSGEWLPFSMRLYAYAGLETIRIVYTFHYDGDPDTDFVKGLGIRFTVPMRGKGYNRHIRFAGDSGYFSEAAKSLHTRRTKGRYEAQYERQLMGETLTDEEMNDPYFLNLLDDSASWNSFKLVQSSADHYRIMKQTKPVCSWVKSAEGRRARGLVYAGGEGGGLAITMRSFWQMHPSGFEVRNLLHEEAELTVWFWSPDAPAMDMRHYDTETHVESAYEGAEEMRATPYGVAHTSELTLWCKAATPSPAQLDAMAGYNESPAQLVCAPDYFHAKKAFGVWSLPDRSVPAKAQLEERLDGIISFYQSEVEQRRWYGFWDYGDFMHSYDPARHVWNYDLGGCAWQNTELAPNMWLWLMFLRTGREDIYRMAEAMTRHTSEVDVYHFGEYAGLGSRHNVVHWGCGCKEARIGMAGLHRYFYYLTADERIGDMMDEAADSDYATVRLDPMRAYFPKDEHPTHIRVGPDWAAFSSNWMTCWERYEDRHYLQKLQTGIECIKQARFGLISGPTYGYDPATGVLAPMGDDNWGRHLALCMGGPQVWMELSGMLKDPQWDEMMADFGVFYNLPQEEKDRITGGTISDRHFEHPVLTTALVAYGAWYRQDRRTADTAWSILLGSRFAHTDLQRQAAGVSYVRELKEIGWMNTNEASQWSLNVIISLALIGEALPGQWAECAAAGGENRNLQ